MGHIAELIKEKRQQKKLTQLQLGLLLGYKGRTAELMVQHWETGRREVPISKLRIVSEVLEIPIEELIP